ncbi:hypothetical protein HKD37_11G032619 [Glycine soja]
MAEEYERRTKHYRKGGAGAVQERNLNVEKIEVQKKELVKWVLEPKTQFAIAASNSLFSA